MRILAAIGIILQGLVYVKAAHYNIDILEVDWNTTTPDAVEVDLKPVQPSRGIYGVSGSINFKEDINTDATLAQVKVFYSSNGITYQLTPFRVPQQAFTKGLNAPYKQYLMDALNECCEDAPKADLFVSPLSKRVIKCTECLFPNDNLPSALRPGYYRLVIMLYNDLDLNISILLKMELD